MKPSDPKPVEREVAAALCKAINRESVRPTKTYGLQTEGKVDRMWLRQVRSSRYEGFVYEGGVTLGQVRLPFAAPQDGTPGDGTPVTVWWDRGFNCAPTAALDDAGLLVRRANALAA